MASSLSVAGKYALVTGAGSGINLAFTRLLLSKGCSVIIGDRTLRPESEKLLKEYPHGKGNGPSVTFQQTDVTSWPQLSKLFNRGLSDFGRLDIVVGGAGIFEPDWSSFWHAPKTESNQDTVSRDPAEAEPGHYAVLDINLTHPIRLSQLAVGYWTRNKMPGCLVHVGSIAGYTYGPATPLYYASKHGLHGFVRSLGPLRDQLGIRSSAVAPGAVRTPMWSEDPSKAAMSKGGTEIPMTPEEIAEAMLQLCENPEYGDGTILESTIGKLRVVPQYHAEPPAGEGSLFQGYVDAQNALIKRLQVDGLST